jgi:signal transduction histidine kinase
MNGEPSGLPIGLAGKFRIFLIAFASLFVFGLLFYTQQITDQLLRRERDVVGLYARSLEYVAANPSTGGDVTFAFEVIRAIDFPIVLTDTANTPFYWKNVTVDTAALSPEEEAEYFRDLIAAMDERNMPIRIAVSDTLVLNYIHYGESELIRKLRWLPAGEISIAAIFLFIAWLGFSYIKRSEQSNIWVGMAKETAHQLGTPLSSLMGWLERLRSQMPEHPQATEALHEMQSDVDRLNKVAARFSKIGSRPDLKDESLPEVIQGVISYISRRLPKSGRTIELSIATPGEFRAPINRELFEWVIENLMKNALDAMEGQPGKITFAIHQAGHRTTIDVTDTGKGIDPKFHKEVFRPGYSTKKRGWGLGLSLSKRIIEDYHKGKLFVRQSTPGQGTTFRIRLTT